MGDRFVQFSLLRKSDAKLIVGHVVARGAGKRVSPQGFVVFQYAVCFQAQTINTASTPAMRPPRTARLHSAHSATSHVSAT